jgi:ABC-type iron transport system FetAB ATPase subunit
MGGVSRRASLIESIRKNPNVLLLDAETFFRGRLTLIIMVVN